MSADFPVEVGKLKFVKKLSVTTLPHRVHDTVPEPRDNVISSTPVAWDTESYRSYHPLHACEYRVRKYSLSTFAGK